MKDETWDWKTKPLNYFEWCWCNCQLTGGEIKKLGLDPEKQHTDKQIAEARIKLQTKLNTLGIGAIGTGWTMI